MPKVEVDEEELVQSRRLRDFVAGIRKNPKANRKLLEAVKEYDPNYPTPELDTARAIEEPVSKIEKEFAAFKAEQAEKDAKREKDEKLRALDNQVETGFAQLRRENWTDAGIEAVRKIMDEKGILDPAIAAAYYEKLHPPATPVTPVGAIGAWNFTETPEGDSDVKRLLETRGQHEGLIDKMAMSALAEVRNGRGR